MGKFIKFPIAVEKVQLLFKFDLDILQIVWTGAKVALKSKSPFHVVLLNMSSVAVGPQEIRKINAVKLVSAVV